MCAGTLNIPAIIDRFSFDISMIWASNRGNGERFVIQLCREKHCFILLLRKAAVAFCHMLLNAPAFFIQFFTEIMPGSRITVEE